MLRNDDEMDALEAALLFMDETAHDAVALASIDLCVPYPSICSSPCPVSLAGIERKEESNGAIADEELERLLLEVGLSSSSSFATEASAPGPAAVTCLGANESMTLIASDQTKSQLSADKRLYSRKPNGSGNQTPSGKVKKRVRINPNRARDNRKNELAYLRNKVRQMENQLLFLRRQSTDSKNVVVTKTAAKVTVDSPIGMPPVWRDMALTQQQRREKAERENARLKLVLESQLKLAKSMEVVMQRRTRQQLAGFNGIEGEALSCAQGSTWDLLLDKDTFDTLLARAEAAYHEVDEMLAANGLKYMKTACANAQLRGGIEGMYVDIFTNKMLPFDFNTAAEAVWTHFRGSEKHRGNLYENFSKDVESSSDTVAEMFAIEFMANDLAADFRVKQVVRRYVEDDRQVVVWVSTASALENSKSPFSSFGFREKGGHLHRVCARLHVCHHHIQPATY
uniref:M96 mating-specific protein family n=1 Tax=Hyaloperonospora arabidopsidis (strain Emoy2) TaxID=559515 RepID=M4C2D1_HYAAE